nr:hypothetical protein [Gilvimarinus chinensis]
MACLPLGSSGQFAVTARSQSLYDQPPLAENPLSGWHGNLVMFQRRNSVLLVHDATRIPLLLPALTKPDFAALNDHFVDAFMNTLLKCDASETQMNAAQRYLRPLQVDTVCNRSEQGTLNQLKGEVEAYLDNGGNIAEMTGYALGAWLASMWRSIKGQPYIRPNREMLTLLDGLTQKTDAAANDA